MSGFKKFLKRFQDEIRLYCLDLTAALAIMFGFTAPVVIGAAGMALDLSQAYLVQERLRNALDAAVLAAASINSEDEAEIKQKVKDFLEANFPEGKTGDLDIESLNVNIVGDDIEVSADANYATTFLRVLNIDEIDVYASTIVRHEIQGIEVVLVLDNTGSMSYDNNIAKLKTAARNFIEILYDSATNPSSVKIGIVPYSQAVNVGPYGLGEDRDGTYYGAAFVDNPEGLDYTTNRWSDDWYGCVEADLDFDLDTTEHTGDWNMYRWKDLDKECVERDGDGDCTRRDYVHDVDGGGPNTSCPVPLLPLTTDRTAMENTISDMRTDGYTFGNMGMAWGMRVLSPEFPFQEGVEYGNRYWRKVIVMMTDGVNTMPNTYTAYGANDSRGDSQINDYEHGIRPDDLDDRFEETCENAKNDGANIYTITFEGQGNLPNSLKNLYRDCATQSSQYYNVDDADELIEVFEQISRELGTLYIRG